MAPEHGCKIAPTPIACNIIVDNHNRHQLRTPYISIAATKVTNSKATIGYTNQWQALRTPKHHKRKTPRTQESLQTLWLLEHHTETLMDTKDTTGIAMTPEALQALYIQNQHNNTRDTGHIGNYQTKALQAPRHYYHQSTAHKHQQT